MDRNDKVTKGYKMKPKKFKLEKIIMDYNGEYVTYFWSKHNPICYKVIHGNVCIAALKSTYSQLSGMQCNDQLPKYVVKKLI